MNQPGNYDHQRQAARVALNFPITISMGSQITIAGELKDLSLKSAFIKVRNSIYLQVNDEIAFAIKRTTDSTDDLVCGSACISRIAPGEGMAIYFTKMEKDSTTRLKELVEGH